jgi:hypothetical protein
LLDDQFCSGAHREAYNERLRKIVSDLSKHQKHSSEGAPSGCGRAIISRDPRLSGDLARIAPSMAAPASSDPVVASAMALPGTAITRAEPVVGIRPASLTTFNGTASLIALKGGSVAGPMMTSGLVPLEPQNLALPRIDGRYAPSLEIGELALNAVQPAGGKPVPRSQTTLLPTKVENHARIGRWRLRIELCDQSGHV